MPIETDLVEYIEWEASSPFRRPDWRWRVAVELLCQDDEAAVAVRHVDEHIYRCLLLARSLARDGAKSSSGDGAELGGLRAAWLLASESANDLRGKAAGIPVVDRDNGGSRDTGMRLGAQVLRRKRLLQRWEIEARLLAGEAPDSIAETVGVSPATVSAFESAFFHVSDRADAKSWISRFAVRKQRSDPLRLPVDFGVVLRHFGFWSGITTLEALLKHQMAFLDAFGELNHMDRGTEEIEELLGLVGVVQAFVSGFDVSRFLAMAEIGAVFGQLRKFREALKDGETTLAAARVFLRGE